MTLSLPRPRVPLLVAVLVIMSAVFLGGPPAARAQVSPTITVPLSAASEVPPVTSTATGTFRFSYDGSQLAFTLRAEASKITQAHIHMAAADANGPVVAFLFGLDAAGVDSINVTSQLTVTDLIGPVTGNFAEFVKQLSAGNLYVNVHTIANPGGEVRGQIPAAPTATYNLALATANEVPPVTGPSTGTFAASLEGRQLKFNLHAEAPSITQTHIHMGSAAANGPVVAFLFGLNPVGVGTVDVIWQISVNDLIGPLTGNWDEFVKQLNAGNLYINVHTISNPGGEIRAQLPGSGAAASPSATPKAPAAGNAALGSGAGGGVGWTQFVLFAAAGAIATGVAGTLVARIRRS